MSRGDFIVGEDPISNICLLGLVHQRNHLDRLPSNQFTALGHRNKVFLLCKLFGSQPPHSTTFLEWGVWLSPLTILVNRAKAN